MTFGILGSGSWGTALAKILTDNGHSIYWWNRSEKAIEQFKTRHHNPQYLPTARFDIYKLHLTTDPNEVAQKSDVILIAIPSAYAVSALQLIDAKNLHQKVIISAIKGILPQVNLLLNDYLKQEFDFPIQNYVAVLGPCHAEEVASEKLSYLTFSGVDELLTTKVAAFFKTSYLNTVVNKDIYGVQYAAVLKNIYAVGAGIAHGLDYGDNFLSVLIANSADEMAGFLRKAGIINAEVGYLDGEKTNHDKHKNYATSVYLGDLLVTCYSLHSRNRAFGNMIGKGYGVKAAQLEMSMVAEGYHASNCMHTINKTIGANMPIATAVFEILWNAAPPAETFKLLEKELL